MLFYIGFLILITRGGGCEQNQDVVVIRTFFTVSQTTTTIQSGEASF